MKSSLKWKSPTVQRSTPKMWKGRGWKKFQHSLKKKTERETKKVQRDNREKGILEKEKSQKKKGERKKQ